MDSGTAILKFYLHIGEDEQLRRFRERLDNPTRRWKISEADFEASESCGPSTWTAYEEVFRRTSTKHAPWYIIPSNHKWYRNLAVARIVAETLESLGMKFPEPTVNLKEIARKYHHAELEEEKKLGKSKWKRLTTEAKRGKGSKKDGETALKDEGIKQSDRATQHRKDAQISKARGPKDSEEADKTD